LHETFFLSFSSFFAEQEFFSCAKRKLCKHQNASVNKKEKKNDWKEFSTAKVKQCGAKRLFDFTAVYQL
jgi:hypothetical protein